MFKLLGLPRARTIGRRGRGVAFKSILLDKGLYCTGASGIFCCVAGCLLRQWLMTREDFNS